MEEQILAAAGWVAGDSRLALRIEEMGLLQNLDARTIEMIAKSVRELSVKAGGRVFAAGDSGRSHSPSCRPYN